jgi:hypothetical protein
MIGSLDLVRLPLGLAQRQALRAGRRGFAGGASFSRLLLAIRLQSMPLPVPQLTTVGFLAVWPSSAELERFRADRLRSWGGAGQRLALTLRPVQGFGRWAGGDPLGGYRSAPAAGPVLLVTHSRARARSTPRFLRADGPVVRALGREDGQLWAGGFMDGVLTLDTGTLSLWRSTADATRFAYAPGVHQNAVRAERHGAWFSESWFGRFAIEAADGRWPGLDLAQLQPAPDSL